MGAWKGSGVLMDRLKAGVELGTGRFWGVCPRSCSGLGSGEEAALSTAQFDGFPGALCLTACCALCRLPSGAAVGGSGAGLGSGTAGTSPGSVLNGCDGARSH